MPIDPNNLTPLDERNARLNAQAMNALYETLNADEFNRVSSLETAHDIWKTLPEIHEGTSAVKEAKLHMLKIKYETFVMLPHENINKMYSRLNNLVNELKGLDSSLTDLDIMRKMLRALPDKYDTLVTIFLNSSELSRMTPTGLLGNLITNELYKKHKKDLLEQVATKKKNIAFMAKMESIDEKIESEDDDDSDATPNSLGDSNLQE